MKTAAPSLAGNQTICKLHDLMSALPPKADIERLGQNVR
jgi:hypothetical protein